MPGVEAYFDHKSVPGDNNLTPTHLGFQVPELLFCTGTVQHYHQPVGLIVATSDYLAMEAAEQVKVYFDPPQEKPLITIQDVLNANAKDRIVEETTVVAKRTGMNVA